MSKLVALLALIALSHGAHASCFGSSSFQTCTDNSGNTYSVQRYGNTTNVQGYGPNGTWNQTSQSLGNTTFHNGTAVNGNSWNGTTQNIGNMQMHQGTNSRGQFYQRTCGPLGCF